MPRQDAEGRWISDDGFYWWDGAAWRLMQPIAGPPEDIPPGPFDPVVTGISAAAGQPSEPPAVHEPASAPTRAAMTPQTTRPRLVLGFGIMAALAVVAIWGLVWTTGAIRHALSGHSVAAVISHAPTPESTPSMQPETPSPQEADRPPMPSPVDPSPRLSGDEIRLAVTHFKSCPGKQADTLADILGLTFSIAHDQPKGSELLGISDDTGRVAVDYVENGESMQTVFDINLYTQSVSGEDDLAQQVLLTLGTECALSGG